jgi:hypothetical protein
MPVMQVRKMRVLVNEMAMLMRVTVRFGLRIGRRMRVLMAAAPLLRPRGYWRFRRIMSVHAQQF